MGIIHEHFQPSIYSADCLKNIKRREKTLNIIQGVSGCKCNSEFAENAFLPGRLSISYNEKSADST